MLTNKKSIALAVITTAIIGAALFAAPGTGIWQRASSGARLNPGTFADAEPPQQAGQTPPIDDDTPSPGFSKRIHGGGGATVFTELANAQGDIEFVGEEISDPPPPEFATLDSELDAYLQEGRGVAVVRVQNIQSEMRSDGSAISQVQVEILDVIQNTAKGGLHVGRSASFDIAGGEFRSGGKKAVVRLAHETLPRMNGQYVWSFFDCSSGVCSVGRAFVAELKGNRLVRVSRRGKGAAEFESLSADEVLNGLRIKALTSRGK